MYSSKYLRDEKFKDTIKKNSCRLRQKSSVQIGNFLTKETTPIQNLNDNKDFINKNKTLERNRTPQNQLLNFIKTKKFQKNDNIMEDRQIIVKKKVCEECTSTIKQRIIYKLKEQRNEKMYNVVNSEENEKLNHNQTIVDKGGVKDILVNRKKFVGFSDIKNIIYRNKKDGKNISNTINKEEIVENKVVINKNLINSTNTNINEKDKKKIYSLKNFNSKKHNNNVYMDKTFKKENNYNIFNKFNNNDNNHNKEISNNNKDNKEKNEKNIISDINNKDRNNKEVNKEINSLYIKKTKNKTKFFSNNYECYKTDLMDNFIINKETYNKDTNSIINYRDNIIINNKDSRHTINNTKNKFSNKSIQITNENKEIKHHIDIKNNKDKKDNNINNKNNNDNKNKNDKDYNINNREKNDNKNKNKNDKDNKENKNNNEKEDNDVIMVHKKESYFNKRYKYKFIKNQEEEKTKNGYDNVEKNIILNKTTTKPEKKLNNFKDIIEKRLSTTNTKRKYKEIHTSIKLSVNKSPAEFEYEYNLTHVGEQDENKKSYLSTEKPKAFSKSTFFKNLFINTGRDNEDFNKYSNDEDKNNNTNIIFRNHLRYKIKDRKDSNYLSNNNLSNSNISIKERGRISDILKSDKKKYFDKTIKINNITNYHIYNYDYVMKMINEAIQLKNSIEIPSLFSILIINFNSKYISTFDYKDFPKEIPKFTECYKYYSIIAIPLIFLHKDEIIYKNSSAEAKIIFEKFIYLSIESIGQKNMPFKKIESFLDEFKKNNKNSQINISMDECCSELIKLIFKNYKEYSPLKKAIEQLLILAKNETLEKLIKTINDTILYCFNHKQKNSFFLLDKKITGNRKKDIYKLNQLSNKDLNKIISTPTTPFIRSAMKKNFCLVLDIDETIVHSMNLPFGLYFLLRPGVINFLEELSKLYEIIIFTSSPKFYADGILNKIDIDNKYISHRLYKDHVVFEKGKSVKKLNMIGRDLNKIIFVDNMKSNAKYNLQNLCHVSTWFYDINDEEIIKLKLKLKYIATNSKYKDDIRKGLECCL